MKRMTDADILAKHDKGDHPFQSAGQLRFSARCSYLDGRDAMAREWNRRAARLTRLRLARDAKATATMPTDLPDFEECDDSGATEHVLEAEPLPTVRPLSDWLGEIARILDEPFTPAPATAAR